MAGIFYTNTSTWFDNLPGDNANFVGDAAYLMDAAGGYETGNLRAWFPYPCNPDRCTDPLRGSVTVTAAPAGDPVRAPSPPRAVIATAHTDGTGVTVQWQPSIDSGGQPVSYVVTATPVAGGSALTFDPIAGTSLETGSQPGTSLKLGVAYTFVVRATNASGVADSAATSAVAAKAAPTWPAGAVISARAAKQSAVVSWSPADANGAQITAYEVTAHRVDATPTAATCATTEGATSCLVTGLEAGTGYTFTVRATNGATNNAGVSLESAPSAVVTPLADDPAGATAAPVLAKPLASPRDTALAVSWSAPSVDGQNPVTRYDVFVDAATTPSCSTSNGATSCTVTGLTNTNPYQVRVQGTNAQGVGVPSPLSDPAIPTPDASPVPPCPQPAGTAASPGSEPGMCD